VDEATIRCWSGRALTRTKHCAKRLVPERELPRASAVGGCGEWVADPGEKGEQNLAARLLLLQGPHRYLIEPGLRSRQAKRRTPGPAWQYLAHARILLVLAGAGGVQLLQLCTFLRGTTTAARGVRDARTCSVRETAAGRVCRDEAAMTRPALLPRQHGGAPARCWGSGLYYCKDGQCYNSAAPY
jgi:hypothetical protein